MGAPAPVRADQTFLSEDAGGRTAPLRAQRGGGGGGGGGQVSDSGGVGCRVPELPAPVGLQPAVPGVGGSEAAIPARGTRGRAGLHRPGLRRAGLPRPCIPGPEPGPRQHLGFP